MHSILIRAAVNVASSAVCARMQEVVLSGRSQTGRKGFGG
jgi:hypothetical protein